MKNSTQDDSAITQRAAEWFFELRNADAGEQAVFGEWLKQSPRHVEEFLLVTAAYKELDAASEIRPDLDKLCATLKASVVPLHGQTPSSPLPSHKRRRNLLRRPWGLAAAVAIFSIGIVLATNLLRGERYSTAIGEIRSLELNDGSLIQLNTRSQVKVEFSADARDIQLLSGEAIFKVARNPARPFRVHAGSAVIQAMGTEFNVYRRAEGTTVSVLEGAVSISDNSTNQTLTASQEAHIATDGNIVKLAKADTAKATAWRQRRLVFSGDRLAEVAAEFNRYNREPQIRVEGELARNKPLAGIFDADDPESLLLFLNGVSDLKTERHADEVVIRARNSSPVDN